MMLSCCDVKVELVAQSVLQFYFYTSKEKKMQLFILNNNEVNLAKSIKQA